MTRNALTLSTVLLAALVLAVAPSALADKGGKGAGKAAETSTNGSDKTQSPDNAAKGPGPSTCGSAPRASVTNSWAWGASGSWGLPGQQVAYHVLVFNDDVGCGSSTFAIDLSAPEGFSISIPQRTITLNSASSGYLWAYVTSPAGAADGDYALNLTSTREGSAGPAGTSTTYYKVYSSDTAAPRLYYPNPWDGAAISGRSYTVGVASSDDHAVKRIDLYLDGAYKATSTCDNLSYECRLSYSWAIRRVRGTHTATFRSYDWVGNEATLTTTFNVN